MKSLLRCLLIAGCLIAIFQICPTPEISAENDNEDKGKPAKQEKDKPAHGDKSGSSSTESKNNGKLEEFSKPYQDKSDQKDKNDKSYHNRYDNCDNDGGGDFWADFWADLLSDVFQALIFGDFGYRYSSCPYNPTQQPLPGIYVSTENSTLGDMMAFQFRTSYNRIDHNIKAYGLYGKLLFPSSWTWDMENTHYLEKAGNKMLSLNYLTTHFNTIGLTPDTNFVTEVGLGMAFLTDAADKLHSSGSFQIRADYFPAEPWSVRTSVSFASPTDIRTTNFNTTIGWHSGALEIFGGYHSLVNNKSRNLNGTTFGLALWF
jgi:hypothetical protein